MFPWQGMLHGPCQIVKIDIKLIHICNYKELWNFFAQKKKPAISAGFVW